MGDWKDNYRLVEVAKERATGRISEVVELTPKDIVGKIEFNNGRERYEKGYTDYHEYGVRIDRRMVEAADYNG